MRRSPSSSSRLRRSRRSRRLIRKWGCGSLFFMSVISIGALPRSQDPRGGGPAKPPPVSSGRAASFSRSTSASPAAAGPRVASSTSLVGRGALAAAGSPSARATIVARPVVALTPNASPNPPYDRGRPGPASAVAAGTTGGASVSAAPGAYAYEGPISAGSPAAGPPGPPGGNGGAPPDAVESAAPGLTRGPASDGGGAPSSTPLYLGVGAVALAAGLGLFMVLR